MYIFIVSLMCAIMLGGVYLAVYENAAEAMVVAFLLFAAIDTGLRSVLNKPSWIVKLLGRKRKKKVGKAEL